jgi:glycosyltransferase involved in cell wall biosynthesis
MRLLMLVHNVAFRGGGTFLRAFHLARRLARRGRDVTVVASSAGPAGRGREHTVEGVRLVEAPGWLPARWRYGYDPAEALWRARWVQRQSFDVVHAFDSRPTVIYPALAAHHRGARLAMDWCDWFGRGGAVEQRPNRWQRIILRPLETYFEETFRARAELTTVINRPLEERARRLGVDPATIHRLPNGADVDSLVPQDRPSARAALGLPAGQEWIGYLGALFAADAALLAEAFERVHAERPSARLVLIGNSRAAPPPAEWLTRTGFVSYQVLGQYLAACDLLCLPLTDSQANRGRWPSKITDYLAAGRAIVGCEVGEVGEILRQTGAGISTAAEAGSFAAGLLGLLADNSRRADMETKARRAAETTYNWSRLAESLDGWYQALLARQPAGRP